METLNVKVYSDYICPYCYLGKYRLEELKEEFPLDVAWVGFEIHPEFPVSGIPFKIANSGGFMNGLIKKINLMAEEMNVEPIRYAETIPNTHLALEFSEAAREEGRFEKVNEALFDAYFKQGRHIGDKEVLKSVGKECGMTDDLIGRCIDGGEFASVIEDARQQAFHDMVSGVPTYVFEGVPVLGVQTMDTMRKVIEMVLKKRVEKQAT